MSPALATTCRSFIRRGLAGNTATLLSEPRFPWDVESPPLPEFPDKLARDAWLKSPDCPYLLYSFVEGENATVQVGKDNPIRSVHAIVADYDCPGLSPDDVAKAIERATKYGAHPTAWHLTGSRGLRVVWLFEKPALVQTPQVFRLFVSRMATRLGMNRVLPSLDPCLYNHAQPYLTGPDWVVTPHLIPPTMTQGALIDCYEEDSKGRLDRGLVIPIEKVAAEAEKRWPGRWGSDWRVGARGVRFWDPAADNPTAAILRETGVQCFTGPKGFVSWEEIFGKAFIEAYLGDKLGRVIADWWFDGTNYWTRLPDETWARYNVSSLVNYLGCSYGLSTASKKDGGNRSEVERARFMIETRKLIAGALPFPHDPSETVEWEGQRYLNTSCLRTPTPSLEPGGWGEGFPWLAELVDTLFPEPGRTRLLAWMKVWMEQIHNRAPRPGTALFIMGPPGNGKTFFSRHVLGGMAGGSADVSTMLTDGDRFNSFAFEKALWVVDDALPALGKVGHRRFAAMVKAAVANGAMKYEQKYGYNGRAPFRGRLVVTLNDDASSSEVLPDADLSLLDKVIFLRTQAGTTSLFEGESGEAEQRARTELPRLMKWLLDWVPPEEVRPDPRFGTEAWHDPEMLARSRAGSESASVLELVDIWRANRKLAHPEETDWTGTATDLYQQVAADVPNSVVPAPRQLGRMLRQLAGAAGSRIAETKMPCTGNRGYKITL